MTFRFQNQFSRRRFLQILAASGLMTACSDHGVASVLATQPSTQVGSASANTYYVSPNGRDADDGLSSSSAWATFAHALEHMAAGDILRVIDGVYSELITVDKSVTIQRHNGTPKLRTNGDGYMVHIQAPGVTIDGLHIEHTEMRPGRDNLVEISADDVTVRNCTIYCSAVTSRELAHLDHDTGDRRAGIRFSDGSNATVEDTEIWGTFFGIHIPGGGGLGAVVRNCNIHHTVGSCIVIQPWRIWRRMLIEGCNLDYSYIEDGIQWQGGRSTAPVQFAVYVRNCTFIGNSENALDFKGCGLAVVDSCMITRTIGSNDGALDGWNTASSMAIMIGTGDISENIIVRNSVLFNNCGGVLQSGKNWKTYNNVIIYNNYNNDGAQSDIGQNNVALAQRDVPNIGVKNNIIGGHRFCQVVSLLNKGYDIDYNIYYKGSDGGSQYVGAVGAYPHHADADERMEWGVWRAKLQSSNDVNGMDVHSAYFEEHATIKFVDVEDVPTEIPREYDFAVDITSPAYRAGGPLTNVASDSSGKSITVADARWFTDGFGATSGDVITIGVQTVRVTNVDLSDNVLLVDQNIDVKAGEPVYFGKSNRPNIGILSL